MPRLRAPIIFASLSVVALSLAVLTVVYARQVDYYEPALVPWVCGAIVIAVGLGVAAELLARVQLTWLPALGAMLLLGVTVLFTVESYRETPPPFPQRHTAPGS
jgi:NAD/NADP transhydrogenase beta subunit